MKAKLKEEATIEHKHRHWRFKTHCQKKVNYALLFSPANFFVRPSIRARYKSVNLIGISIRKKNNKNKNNKNTCIDFRPKQKGD